MARRSRTPLTDERVEGRIGGLKHALWACRAPLPEMPRIKGHYCFDPEQIDRLEVEGEIISDESC